MAQQAEETASTYGKRLYISRSNATRRKIIGEDRIVELLGLLGFSIVHPENLSVAQQVKIFSGAEVVVSPHGAALTNTVFCSPGTRVLELFSPRTTPPCYWILAAHCRLEYQCLVGESIPSSEDAANPAEADILLDIEKLKRALGALRVH